MSDCHPIIGFEREKTQRPRGHTKDCLFFLVVHMVIVVYLSIYMYFFHQSFWASDPLIDRFYSNLSIKGSEAQKQRPHELL